MELWRPRICFSDKITKFCACPCTYCSGFTHRSLAVEPWSSQRLRDLYICSIFVPCLTRSRSRSSKRDRWVNFIIVTCAFDLLYTHPPTNLYAHLLSATQDLDWPLISLSCSRCLTHFKNSNAHYYLVFWVAIRVSCSQFDFLFFLLQHFSNQTHIR